MTIIHTLYTDYPFEELGDVPGQKAPFRECEFLEWERDIYVKIKVDNHIASIKRWYVYQSLSDEFLINETINKLLDEIDEIKKNDPIADISPAEFHYGHFDWFTYLYTWDADTALADPITERWTFQNMRILQSQLKNYCANKQTGTQNHNSDQLELF